MIAIVLQLEMDVGPQVDVVCVGQDVLLELADEAAHGKVVCEVEVCARACVCVCVCVCVCDENDKKWKENKNETA